MIIGLTPVTLPVTCGGQQHALRWDGDLSAPDHPHVDRERALAALGGEPAECVRILDAWRRHVDDLDVLVQGSRGPQDQLAQEDSFEGDDLPSRMFGIARRRAHVGMHSSRASRGWWSFSNVNRYVDFDGEDERPPDDLGRLLTLGAGLPHRLAAVVVDEWAGRIEAADERVTESLPTLDAALYGRFRAALATWLGTNRLELDFDLLAPGQSATLHWKGKHARAAAPFSWLRDVWVPGLAVVLDRFCFDARWTDRGWELSTVDREGAITSLHISS